MNKIYNEDNLETFKRIPDGSISSIITDPPYNILNHKIERVIDIPLFMKECYRVLKPDSFLVYFGMQPTLTNWNLEAFKLFSYKNEVIWYKRQPGSPFLDMSRVFENIIIVTKGNPKYNKVKRPYHDVRDSLSEYTEWSTIKRTLAYIKQALENKESWEDVNNNIDNPTYNRTRVDNKQEGSVQSCNTKKEDQYYTDMRMLSQGTKPQNLLSFAPHNRLKRDMSKNGNGDNNVKHPTVKPIDLIKYLIELTTTDGIIYDPFIGSGTTTVAINELNNGEGTLLNKKTNLEYIGSEIIEDYYKIAVEREVK